MSSQNLFSDNIMTLTDESNILILTMKNGENRFSRSFVNSLNEALDAIEKTQNPKVLIITGSDKFFSNGLDLGGIQKDVTLLPAVTKVLSRILVLGIPTVAAINGHAYGAGLFLAMCCDWRFMRKDRGYLCFPEVDLGLPFSWGFAKVVTSKIEKNLFREMSLLAKKYDASEAKQKGIVDDVFESSELLSQSKKFATTVLLGKSKHRGAYHKMKVELYIEAYLGLKNFSPTNTDEYASTTKSKL
ncbi:Enoyl-CoA hydratase/isomerase [Reticulomyxa filosa]|uniref:Enoyl-CoA hydratase/isomerase n=1 Tax=Reticulomyxa filosa TaxID=46433 RepID=X6P7F7_RETFI|nr:Enoyl-CoA hydratase/isomerase [Reticulomyxa filosa]|eukprot:ETO34445.1 Enoyl-CoA hydratase/isomerase [Reticulomyxa filosa]